MLNAWSAYISGGLSSSAIYTSTKRLAAVVGWLHNQVASLLPARPASHVPQIRSWVQESFSPYYWGHLSKAKDERTYPTAIPTAASVPRTPIVHANFESEQLVLRLYATAALRRRLLSLRRTVCMDMQFTEAGSTFVLRKDAGHLATWVEWRARNQFDERSQRSPR